jgi:hypothetical protein
VGFVGLLGQSVLLGLAAAFTPSLLALQVLIVSGDPWRRRSLAVAIGSATAFAIVGAMLFFGFAQLPQIHSVQPDSVENWLHVVAGVALLAGAVYLFRPHPLMQRRAEAEIRAYVSRASSLVFLGVAFALSIKDLSSFIVMAPALHDIAVANINDAEQALLLIVLYACALSPVLVPPALRLVFGHRADRSLRSLYRFTMDHQFQLVGAMCLLIGAYLLVTGLVRM